MNQMRIPAFVFAFLTLAGCSPAGETASNGAAETAANEALEPRDTPEVRVVMSEFAFTTSDSVFEAGVPYRFVLVNEGLLPHEWAVVPRGDADESRLLVEVEEEDLPPGATVVHDFTFPDAGEYDFSCFMAGHDEGGMVLPVRVRAAG